MGKRLEVLTSTNVTLTTTTETVVATLTGVNTPYAGVRVDVTGWAQVTTGTNTTALTLRIRRGTAITDTLVGEANPEQIEAAAGSTEGHSIQVYDTPGEVASQPYVLTVQQAGASADGATLQASMVVDVVY